MPQGTWGRVGLCTDGKGETFAERSTNGNCRLEWDVIYARPGTHQLRAQLLIGGRGAPKPIEVLGPQRLLPSTNTFWLEPFYNAFSNSRGAVLHANIAGSNASYSVALFDMRGNHIRTFQGNLADNTLDIHWDLTDSEGRTVPDKDVNAVYSIEVPGRSRQVQTQQITRTFP